MNECRTQCDVVTLLSECFSTLIKTVKGLRLVKADREITKIYLAL
jgi:hypothetical protein